MTIPAFSSAMERQAIGQVLAAAIEWQLAHPSRHPRWHWAQAPFWISLAAFAPVSGDPARYFAAVQRNGEEIHWRPGPRPLSADDHAITQSYFMLHRALPDPAIIRPALLTLDAVVLFPFDESLEFVARSKTWRQWVWCDALFMSPPALALASSATGKSRYLDFMDRMWWKTTDYLYDKEDHLYYRDSRFFGKRTSARQKVFWSRGNAWVLAGLARVLQEMPAGYAQRPRYEALFREMAARVAELQQGDGYWRSNLLDPDATAWPETSGTGLFIHALAWGVNQGLLDRAEFEPVLRAGWAALIAAVHPDGKLGHVQQVGDQPAQTGPDDTEIFGVGAFVLAGAELLRRPE